MEMKANVGNMPMKEKMDVKSGEENMPKGDQMKGKMEGGKPNLENLPKP